MNLTVDASIIVKWFVAEPLAEEARRLLAPRLRLYAPEILLAEFTNTIWKKARRGEIEDTKPHFDELASLPDIVTLHPDGQLVGRAAQLAAEIDHPVYDCLYWACAEAMAPGLVTADKRFVHTAAGHLPNVDVLYIGAPGVADMIATAATTLVISRDKVEALSAAYEVFAATSQHVVTSLRGEPECLIALTPENQNLIVDSPSFRRLVEMIGTLNDEELVDLLALGWLGAGLLDGDWQRALEHASEMVGRVNHDYVAGYGRDWRKGYARVSRLTRL